MHKQALISIRHLPPGTMEAAVAAASPAVLHPVALTPLTPGGHAMLAGPAAAPGSCLRQRTGQHTAALLLL